MNTRVVMKEQEKFNHKDHDEIDPQEWEDFKLDLILRGLNKVRNSSNLNIIRK
jgi:hypothetical protein